MEKRNYIIKNKDMKNKKYFLPENNEAVKIEIEFSIEEEIHLNNLLDKMISKMKTDGEDFWDMECYTINSILRQIKNNYKPHN